MWYVEVLGMASTDEEAACQLKDVAMLVGDWFQMKKMLNETYEQVKRQKTSQQVGNHEILWASVSTDT